jgi:hypothetical protein
MQFRYSVLKIIFFSTEVKVLTDGSQSPHEKHDLEKYITKKLQFKKERGWLNLDFGDDASDDHLEAGAEGAVDEEVHRGVHHEQQMAETEQ